MSIAEWRCRLSGEERNDSEVSPMSSWLKPFMNHHLWGQVEVFVRVLFVSSFSPSWVQLSGHRHQNILCHQLSVSITKQLQFLSQTLLLRPITWEAEVGHVQWDIRQEKEETGWLIGDVSPGGVLLALWQKKNDWQWVFAWLADIGTQRWVSGEGQDGERRARMRTGNKVMQSVSPTKLWRGKRAFEVEFLTALNQKSDPQIEIHDNNQNNFSSCIKKRKPQRYLSS